MTSLGHVDVSKSLGLSTLRRGDQAHCETRTNWIDFSSLHLKTFKRTHKRHAMAKSERKVGIPVDGSEHSEKACDCK